MVAVRQTVDRFVDEVFWGMMRKVNDDFSTIKSFDYDPGGYCSHGAIDGFSIGGRYGQ